jgi:type IV pilus assembly protein PilF
MLCLLSEMVRKCSNITTRLAGFPKTLGLSLRRHPRIATLLILTLFLAGLVAGGAFYCTYQWRTAQEAVKANRLDDAQRRLDFCLYIWPRSIPVHLLAARAARLNGDFEGAEKHLNLCLKINRGASEEIQLEYLLLRVQGGEVDEVANDLLTLYVGNDNPESPLILETLARAYMQHLRYGPAFNCLDRWQKLEPDSAEPHRWRGWVLERMSNREGAMKEYKDALEINPNLDLVRLRLAEMYLESHDPLSALPHLERLRVQFPNRADVLARLGQCRFLQGKLDEARQLMEAAEPQLPKDTILLTHLAKVAMQAEQPRPEDAKAYLSRILEIDPTDTEAENLMISCLQYQGRNEEAQDMIERRNRDEARIKRVNELLQQEAKQPIIDPADMTNIGTLFIRANERVGRYWLNRALERDPDYQPALEALAEHYEGKGEYEKANQYRRKMKEASRP